MPSAARLGDLIGHAPPIPPNARGPGGPGGVPTGLIVGPCSGNVFINGIRAAREGVDMAACSLHPPLPLQIASGSSNVFINGCPAARLGDLIKCSAIIVTGSGNVFIGGGGSGAGGTVKTDLVMPECETGSVMLQSLEAADADAGCFAPGAPGSPMSYGEQMRKVGGFVGDLGIGAARGLLNLVPETFAFAYRMGGYAIAGVVSHIDSDISGAMFAKYEKVTGRLWQYDNSVQAFGGVAAQVASPMIYKGASAAGVAIYNAERGAAWVTSGGVPSTISLQEGAINFPLASAVNTISPGEALRAKYSYMTAAQRASRLEELAEGNAYRRLKEIESSTPGAHFLEKHGAQTTLQSQLERAQYGVNPTTGIVETYANGNPKIPSSATRFLSNRDQLNAIDRAQNIYRLTSDVTLAERPINFNYLIGEGYKKTSLAYGQSYSAQVWFRQGNVTTAFPIWGQ